MKILIILLTLSSISFSEAKIFRPSELASLAEERAPLIKMQMENRSAAASQVSQSRLFANPIFAVQAGGIKAGGDRGGVTDLTINQPIPWPGKRFAEIESSKILEKMTLVDLEESRLLVNHSVSLLSLELAVLEEMVKRHAERKERFSVINKFLNSRPMASPSQRIEKNLIENQIRIVESEMFDYETKRKSTLEQLCLLSGEQEVLIGVNWNLNPGLPSKESFQLRLEKNPRYQKSLRLTELAKNRIEQAKYLAKPDLLVGVNYRQENTNPANHFYHANFAVVIPIMDRGQHSVQVASAQARREEAGKALVMIDAFNQLNRSYQALLSAHRSTELFRVADVPKIEQRFSDAEDAFKKGRIDVTTLLQTDTQIYESMEISYMSYLKYFTALSEVRLLTGEKLDVP